MSLKSWKDQFYKKHSGFATRTDREAVDHCILKWEGLKPKNLTKHNVRIINGPGFQPTVVEADKIHIIDDYLDGKVISDTSDGVIINASTCALCKKYPYVCSNNRESCPLDVVSGNKCGKAYESFTGGLNPTPMITLLNKAKIRYVNLNAFQRFIFRIKQKFAEPSV